VLIFFLLALVALLFVLAPALRPRQTSDQQSSAQLAAAESRSWYEQRLRELGEEELDTAQKTEITEELAAVLLAEYPQTSPESLDAPIPPAVAEPAGALRRPANVLLMSGVLLVLMAVGVYAQLGSFGASKIQGAQAVLALSPEQDLAELQRWQAVLGDWLGHAPEDAQSWYLLGHAHLKLGEFAQAEEAFAEAHQFARTDVSVKFYWLQARYLNSQGVLDTRSRQLAEEILAADPNSPQVLEMLAVAAISEGDAATAVTLLNRTLNSEQRPERVRSTVDAIAALRSAATAQGGQADVRVQVEAATEAEYDPMATVFVVARPVGGGMPFAVVRRPAWLLPFEVTLDDLVSMSAERLLSQAQVFEVLVRLSASGDASNAEGDWQWLSSPLSLSVAKAPQSPLQARIAPPE
jgi:cytochrome c-type biogenesis protein CcmH